jgi:hypothetical protein
MTSIDTNVDNYTISELMEIIDEKELEVKTIKSKTDKLINQFKKSNPNLSTFFLNIQSKLIQYTENTIIENSKTDNFNKETEEWYKNEALPQANDNQRDKITDRVDKVDVYGNQHVPMKREQLGVSNTYNVPVAQDSLNPNLKNTITRFVNLDSQFRQFNAGSESISTDYTLDLSDPLVNTLSIRLFSFQVPFSWYTIDNVYGNTCFWITNNGINVPIIIPGGNYTPSEFVIVLNNTFASALFLFPTTVPVNTPVSYNKNSGKITMSLINGVFNGGIINGKLLPTFTITTDTIITFYDYTSELINELLNTNVNTINYLNQTLGWVMGYRSPYVNVEVSGNIAPSILDLNGTKYLILVIDDYNQNHVNNGLVSITELSNVLKLPSYYSPDLPYVFVNPDGISNNLNSLVTAEGPNNQNGLLIAGKMNVDYSPTQIIIPSAPRTLTQSQIYTINQININKNKNTNFRAKAPTSPDILAILPIKTSNLNTGTMISEMSGSLQDNIRVYFGPVNIERMKIKLLDDKGNIVNLNGLDWCVTLVCECLYQY